MRFNQSIMDYLENQLGLDFYLPGCDKYHKKSRPVHLPYELIGLRRIPPHIRDENAEETDRRRFENPSSLEEACAYGCIAHVITFWAQGIDMKGHRTLYEGVDATPLMWAALRNRLPVARFLIDQKVDINEANGIGHTALHWAISGCSYEAIRLLVENGADPTLRDLQGYSSYMNAVQGGNLGLLLILCEFNPLDVRERDADGHSLLHWAAYANALATCQYLVEKCHIDMDARDNSGRTALVWAAREGYAEVVEYLVSQGARTELTDEDGFTPLQHARNRNHREAAHVLKNHPAARRNGVTASVDGGAGTRKRWTADGYVPVITMRRAGTLRMMLRQPMFLAMALLGVVYVVLAFIGSIIVPPIMSHILLGLFFFRNVLWTQVLGFPEQGGRPEPTPMEKIGVSKTFGESARGVWLYRNRDPASLCAIVTFIFIQQYAWTRLGLSSMLFQHGDAKDVALVGRTKVQNPYAEGEGFVLFTSKAHMEQLVILFLLGTVTLSAVLCKLCSMRSVHEMSDSLDNSPIWTLLRKRAYRWLHPRIFFLERHALIPLRAFYCNERDVVLRRYDGYSISLDCPVAESNHVFFFLFVNAFACLQWLLFFWSWEQASDLLECPESPSFLWSLVVSPWNLFVHGLPCADAAHAVGATWGPWLSLLKYIIPTTANHYGVWVMQYSLAAALMSTCAALRQWVGVWYGATRMELANQTATSSEGGLVSVFPQTANISAPWVPPLGAMEGIYVPDESPVAREGAVERSSGARCIYSGSSGFANVAAFMLGIAGRRWRNAMAVSLSNTPVYTAAPLNEGIV